MRIQLLFPILFFFFVSYLRAETYYASPTGGGNGRSFDNPFKISAFWSVANPGDTLLLLDGWYTGDKSMIKPPKGLNGAPNNPITVRALNDGKVEIDGQNQNRTVYLTGNNYFVLEGFNAHNAFGTSTNHASVIHIFNSNNNIVRRVCAWDSQDGNGSIFSIHNSNNNLIEDCAGWGTARKIFSSSIAGNNTTLRRCWGRWEHSTYIGPKMTYTAAYNNYNMIIENCIGTWDMQKMSSPPDQAYGVLGRDRLDGSKKANSQVLGSIFYTTADQTFTNAIGVSWMSKVSNFTFENLIVYSEHSHFDVLGLYNSSEGGDNLQARHVTAIGPANKVIASDWNTSNIYVANDATELIKVNGHIMKSINGNGATVVNRYVEGELTNEPLWPWPMNQRIIDAMILAGYEPVDVTKTVFELGGGTMPDFGGSPQPLSVSISANPTSGNIPLVVKFSVTPSHVTSPINYSWNFQDENTSNEQNPTHTFIINGTYNVVLSISDDKGQSAQDTIKINVQKDTQPPIPPTGPEATIVED